MMYAVVLAKNETAPQWLTEAMSDDKLLVIAGFGTNGRAPGHKAWLRIEDVAQGPGGDTQYWFTEVSKK